MKVNWSRITTRLRMTLRKQTVEMAMAKSKKAGEGPPDLRDLTDLDILMSDQIIVNALSDATLSKLLRTPEGVPIRDAYTVEDAKYLTDRVRLLAMGHKRN